ncbi:MAG: hypothetical protein JW958_00560 [Candidatus Eisenbacteria bacterium]|nr:hypothetical protein [Candidatus Eisenbacteria bacterium]
MTSRRLLRTILLFTLIAFAGTALADGDPERGLTTPVLPGVGGAAGDDLDRAVVPVPSREPLASYPSLHARDDSDWALVQSDSFFTCLRAGETQVIHFDRNACAFAMIFPEDPVIARAYEAIDYAPDWMGLDLRDAFSRLDPTTQDFYAGLILSAVDPYVDEVAFVVAHTAPEVLTSGSFPTDILQENAEDVYAHDPYLDYVEIVDYGSASTGGDYYSTVSYQTAAERGTTTVELPRERYYWDIVHPKITDEMPLYIDPDTGDPASPPAGRFWREYVFTHADSGFPILRDALAGIQVLWEGNVDSKTNGAVGAITQWIQDALDFGSGAERPIQPVRILAIHLGRCGEHADITAAASRAALIPTNSASAVASDHTWNEFWDQRWVPWEPVNNYVDSGWHYEGWGKSFNAIFDWRGDDWTWTVTERYTPSCTLTVFVADSLGYPVDGAKVTNAKRIDGTYYIASAWDYTDSRGMARFIVGDSQELRVRFDSEIGSYPTGPLYRMACDSSMADSHYVYARSIAAERPRLPMGPAPLPKDRAAEFQLRITFAVGEEYVYGQNSIGGKTFSDRRPSGAVEFFLCDEANYAAYQAPDSFTAYEILEDEDSATVVFTLPTDGDWYAVLSNEEHLVNTQVLSGRAELYCRFATGVAGGENLPAPRTALGENRPNPFNPLTAIRFTLAREGRASVTIYDPAGRRVRTLLSGALPAGDHEAVWDGRDDRGRDVAAGVYFCRLDAGDARMSRKMVLLR